MSNPEWNPWKTATLGILVILATVLVTSLVVAHYMESTSSQPANGQPLAIASTAGDAPPLPPAVPPAAAPPAPAAEVPPAAAPAPPHHHAARPARAAIDDCNRYAASTGHSGTDTFKDALIGGGTGAGLGAAGGAIAGGGGGAGKGAGIGGIVGAVAGTLYGLNESNQQDTRVAAAYRNCMRRHGYSD